MNFLFHIYISKEDKDEMIGNFLGDFVKGEYGNVYPPSIQKGIIIHRKLDGFSNKTTAYKKNKTLFPEKLKKISPVAIDIFYDHFLAKNFKKLCNLDLLDFSLDFYNLLEVVEPKPERLKKIFPYLKEENWLYRYTEIDFIELTVKRVSRRFKRKNDLPECFSVFWENYSTLEEYFFLFHNEILDFKHLLDSKLNTFPKSN
ncbi:Acyl carrier protein phosphodiesterase [Persephonella hydrogeniphila]|uniref:Acyl carrier protein phosphodiesterase n=1 Tax=Persephonella hydrogeniphila TaxID=198703 RepID=A0A285NBQ9_9AQUI|nr:ACP phosphodiesterase [Persephonella hydrogeniphila]SNZ06870.1 Acyl carrier protein phosphodiesterase [Persephonella hydrogeniphila]